MRYFKTAFQLKMPAWKLSEHFPQSSITNFPQEKATKSALALPEVLTERNSMLAMIRLLVFISSPGSLSNLLTSHHGCSWCVTTEPGATFHRCPPCHQALGLPEWPANSHFGCVLSVTAYDAPNLYSNVPKALQTQNSQSYLFFCLPHGGLRCTQKFRKLFSTVFSVWAYEVFLSLRCVNSTSNASHISLFTITDLSSISS